MKHDKWVVGLATVLVVGCGDGQHGVQRLEVAKPAVPALPPAVATKPAAAPATPPADLSQKEINLGAITLTNQEGWIRKPPSVNIILAEMTLPRAKGDEADGRLTVSTAGGSVKENVERWRGQFVGKLEAAKQEELDLASVKVTVVDFAGTYRDQRGPFAPGVERPDYRMLGAIIPAEGESYFVKCYGPKKTMEGHAEGFRKFVRSLRVGKG